MAQEFSQNSPSLYNDPAGGGAGGDKALKIDAQAMWDASTQQLPGIIELIEDTWKGIGRTWDDLKLGWTGSSSHQAQAFNHKLQAAQNDMFGKKGATAEQSEPGIIRLLRGKTVNAADIYGETEQVVVNMFNDFAASLTGESDGKAKAPTSDSNGPIAVSYDNKNGVRYQAESPVIGRYMDEDGVYHDLRQDFKIEFKHQGIADGGQLIGAEPYINHTWIDHDGHEHTEKIDIAAAIWKDSKGEVHDITPPNAKPLPMPDSVK